MRSCGLAVVRAMHGACQLKQSKTNLSEHRNPSVVSWCNPGTSSVSSSGWCWVHPTTTASASSCGGAFSRLCRNGGSIAGSSVAGSSIARSSIAGSSISYYATRCRERDSPWRWRGRSRGIRGREFAWLVDCFPKACFGRPLLLQCEKSEAAVVQAASRSGLSRRRKGR